MKSFSQFAMIYNDLWEHILAAAHTIAIVQVISLFVILKKNR